MDLAELAVISTALIAVGLEDVNPPFVSNTFGAGFFSKWSAAVNNAWLKGGVDSAPSRAGAAVFSAYIVAALTLTVSVLASLRNAYKALPAARKASAGFQARLGILSMLALVSFASLSYNMLSFLIVNYQAWSEKSISSIVPIAFFPRLWYWATTNRLFYSFSTDLFRSTQGYWWTRQGLFASLLCALFMGVEGKRRKATYETLPLLRLFLLNQILPASFAQSLFFLSLLVRSDSSHTLDHLLVTRPPYDPSPQVTVQKTKGDGETIDLAPATFLEGVRNRVAVLIPAVPYGLVLAFAPVFLLSGASDENFWVIPGVLALRAILFVPYYLPSHDTKAKGYETWRHTLVAVAFYITARNAAYILSQPGLIETLNFDGDLIAAGESFAVKALGRDYIVWQVVVVTWSLISWIKTD